MDDSKAREQDQDIDETNDEQSDYDSTEDKKSLDQIEHTHTDLLESQNELHSKSEPTDEEDDLTETKLVDHKQFKREMPTFDLSRYDLPQRRQLKEKYSGQKHSDPDPAESKTSMGQSIISKPNVRFKPFPFRYMFVSLFLILFSVFAFTTNLSAPEIENLSMSQLEEMVDQMGNASTGYDLNVDSDESQQVGESSKSQQSSEKGANSESKPLPNDLPNSKTNQTSTIESDQNTEVPLFIKKEERGQTATLQIMADPTGQSLFIRIEVLIIGTLALTLLVIFMIPVKKAGAKPRLPDYLEGDLNKIINLLDSHYDQQWKVGYAVAKLDDLRKKLGFDPDDKKKTEDEKKLKEDYQKLKKKKEPGTE